MIYNKDCLDGVRDIRNGSVDLLVTDPPYGIGFMGKDWDRALPDKRIWAYASGFPKAQNTLR